MSSKDYTNIVLKCITKKDKAQLEDKVSKLIVLRDSIPDDEATSDEAKQSLNEVIVLTRLAHTYNKNDGFSDDLFTIADKLKASSDKALQKRGKTLANQLNTQKQAILDWNIPSKKNVALHMKINRTHNNILTNVVAFENAVVKDIESRFDSVGAQEAALAMDKAVAKSQSKSANEKKKKGRKEEQEEVAVAKRNLEEFKANPSGKSDKENEVIEEQLKQAVAQSWSNTTASYQTRKRKERNEEAATAKKRLEDHRATGKSNEESKLVELELKQDAYMKASKTCRGRYQLENAICGFKREDLVSTAVDQLRRGRFRMPLAGATKRSKKRCEQFSEAFLSRDLKKMLSLYFDK